MIGLAATIIGGYLLFKEASENAVERRMTMELSMTIALVAALAIGEFFTALIITEFVLGAEILEGMTPVDGQVVSGRSFVEQAAITGEPVPSEKSSGSEVYAGTMN